MKKVPPWRVQLAVIVDVPSPVTAVIAQGLRDEESAHVGPALILSAPHLVAGRAVQVIDLGGAAGPGERAVRRDGAAEYGGRRGAGERVIGDVVQVMELAGAVLVLVHRGMGATIWPAGMITSPVIGVLKYPSRPTAVPLIQVSRRTPGRAEPAAELDVERARLLLVAGALRLAELEVLVRRAGRDVGRVITGRVGWLRRPSRQPPAKNRLVRIRASLPL